MTHDRSLERPLLQALGVTKAFPGVQALTDVSFNVAPGEVHALLGENGAGKSTLMKVIGGSVTPDEGTVTLDGEKLPLGDPVRTRQRGVGVVYQELSLVESVSVAENVLLGQWPLRRGTVDQAALEKEARRRLDLVGLEIPLSTRAREFGVATRQRIELAKALSAKTRVLLLDEPTSALSDPEAQQLFSVIEHLSATGVGIVYVSHRLPEIMQVANRVTVLRDGERVETHPISEVDESDLARWMVGRDVALNGTEGHVTELTEKDQPPALKATGFGRPPRLKPVNLEVAQGEIVAVFGLVGAGRTRLANALFGIEPATTGQLEVFGKPIVTTSPRGAITAGLGYVGESRHVGLLPSRSIAENITLASLHRMRRRGLLSHAKERRLAEHYIDELRMRVAGPEQPVATLSGGNQQKVLLARSLCSEARILILDDPTRGVDIGAKEEVFRMVRNLAATGVAVLYLTSEIKEARALAHRLLVMSNGELVNELPADATDDHVMAAAGGVHG